MSYRARKFLSLIVLVFGLPLYIAAALFVVDQFDRPHILVETAVYIVLGILWALPLKWLFKGIGREDPDQQG